MKIFGKFVPVQLFCRKIAIRGFLLWWSVHNLIYVLNVCMFIQMIMYIYSCKLFSFMYIYINSYINYYFIYLCIFILIQIQNNLCIDYYSVEHTYKKTQNYFPTFYIDENSKTTFLRKVEKKPKNPKLLFISKYVLGLTVVSDHHYTFVWYWSHHD
jgi:hypothetical protein